MSYINALYELVHIYIIVYICIYDEFYGRTSYLNVNCSLLDFCLFNIHTSLLFLFQINLCCVLLIFFCFLFFFFNFCLCFVLFEFHQNETNFVEMNFVYCSVSIVKQIFWQGSIHAEGASWVYHYQSIWNRFKIWIEALSTSPWAMVQSKIADYLRYFGWKTS